jgi:hypothetical protein
MKKSCKVRTAITEGLDSVNLLEAAGGRRPGRRAAGKEENASGRIVEEGSAALREENCTDSPEDCLPAKIKFFFEEVA